MFLTLYWKAYSIDRKGVKSPKRDKVILEVDHRLFSLSEMIEKARPKIIEQYPDLASCQILITDCDFQEKNNEPVTAK